MNGSGSGRYLEIENVKARNSCIGTNTMGGFPYRWDFTIRSKAWIFYISFFWYGWCLQNKFGNIYIFFENMVK